MRGSPSCGRSVTREAAIPSLDLNRAARLHSLLRAGVHLWAAWGLLQFGLPGAGWLILGLNYLLGMLAVTVGYHRYFSHRAFETSRAAHSVMGFLGCCQLQGGPIAWSRIHRHHHRHSDRPEDLHAPLHGLYQSHLGWLSQPETYAIALQPLPDLSRYPELVWLERYNFLPPLLYLLALWGLGEAWQATHPGSVVTGLSTLVWGGALRWVLVWHATWSVNSVCHLWGTRPHDTRDQSRNNLLIALITLGEGWHNNHHRYPAAAQQGLRWWEVDTAFWVICALERAGVVWGVRRVRR